MGKTKEQRIRKLKKSRIWPSVLGLFLILILFSIILVAVLSASAVDIVQKKLVDSIVQTENVAELFADYDAKSKDKIEQTVLSHIDILDEVEAVSVIDADKNPVWSSNNVYPETDESIDTEFLIGDREKKISIILSDDEDQVFIINDDEVVVNKDLFVDIESIREIDGVNDIINIIGKTDLDITTPFTHMTLWFVVPVNDMEVMVLNKVPFFRRDFIMMITSLVLFAIMIAIFVIYYLISIIGMVMRVRRTTKIIYTDMVTGGDNWLSFIKKGTGLLKKNRRGQLNYAVLHLEMRKYRSFCTCFGVNKGQELIEKFHNTLKKEIQRKEVMAHQENSAFGLLLTYTDKADLEARIHKIENMLNTALPGMKMYFSTGIYLVQAGEYDVEQLYNNAMIACEMSDNESESSIAYFDVEMNKQKMWERKVEDDMDRALANREFQVYLQPKISTSEEVLGGAEALVRWIHPTEGFIPPNRFIPIFEKNGFILKLDDYMLEEIARVQSEWLAEGRQLVPISVNVSRAHFTREDLAEHICAIVDKYQVPHNVIELELTESAFFDDKNVLLNTVQKLREAGFQVSMDDFGAGYSSLNSLKELRIDVLKIDADFFRGADAEERGLLIVSEVIGLAKKLNMKIVAEGIESKEQVEFLTEQECDLIQGYFYAKPMPVAEFAQKYAV
ncbi:MAG: EAL domain-containing protein [Oscillospiraceae bacterium]|nr:EAL domain-containing protein [Oscillospiraceae bacterium]